jgi:hypothetical protein
VKSLPAPDLDKPSPEMLDNEDDLHAAHDEAFEEIDEVRELLLPTKLHWPDEHRKLFYGR